MNSGPWERLWGTAAWAHPVSNHSFLVWFPPACNNENIGDCSIYSLLIVLNPASILQAERGSEAAGTFSFSFLLPGSSSGCQRLYWAHRGPLTLQVEILGMVYLFGYFFYYFFFFLVGYFGGKDVAYWSLLCCFSILSHFHSSTCPHTQMYWLKLYVLRLFSFKSLFFVCMKRYQNLQFTPTLALEKVESS